MILTHEQAHTAHKIMLLALEGGSTGATMYFLREGVMLNTKGGVLVYNNGQVIGEPERYPTLADFATAYDVAGTAQRIEYTKAAQSWGAFWAYHTERGRWLPCTREQFERLGVAGRVTKMILGVWA